MKTFVRLARFLSLLLCLCTLPCFAAAPPSITNIALDASEVTVTVHVPAGIHRVTLESRTRLGAGSWIPVQIQRTDGTETTLIFTVTLSTQLEVLRVRGDTTEEVPTSFFSGQKDFLGHVAMPGGELVFFSGAGGELAYPVGDPLAPPVPPVTASPAIGGSNRTVTESDIWAIHQDTLYFFNQHRGLQVIDIADSMNPTLLGSLSIPAEGEQMYVLDDDHVVLLADGRCLGTRNWIERILLPAPPPVPLETSSTVGLASTAVSYTGGTSQVFLIHTSNGQPAHLASLTLHGRVLESRLVGTALYVASQTYRQTTVTNPDAPSQPDATASRGAVSSSWEQGTLVSSFDLSDPANPLPRGSLWFPGSGHDIYATNQRLFISTQDPASYWKSVVHMIDISAPDGTLQELASIPAAGRVQDKFKMNLSGDIFTAISQLRLAGEVWTVLETFDVQNSANPNRLAAIKLAKGETVFGTRFDGDKAYIVTFLRIDPLWIVSLADPANPVILGELEVPGWSTYVHPIGDRLVTIGIDDTAGWRVAVSLFDVGDPANPSLLDKEILGDSRSQSEANQDEKAFNVLPEHGLILVPFSGHSQNGYARQIQLIDLHRDTLTLRGNISHQMQPRRATMHDNSILSISARELISVDATDRDQPAVQSVLTLSWKADRVFAHGEYLIELDEGEPLGQSRTPPVLRVVAKADPHQVLQTIPLPKALRVSGIAKPGDHLFVLQTATTGYGTYLPPAEEDGQSQEEPPEPQENVFLSAYHLDLPTLTGGLAASIQVENLGGGQLQLSALWPKDDVLVWHHAGTGYSYGWWDPWFGRFDRVLQPGLGMPRIDVIMPWPYHQPSKPTFIAFDTSTPTQPSHLSTYHLDAENRYSFSSAFTAGNKVFLSYQEHEWISYPVPDGSDKSDTTTVNNIWIRKHFLAVIDYSDPANPTAWLPVDLPGTLKGLSHQGAVLYTEGHHWNQRVAHDGQTWLDALAYDGLEAALVASLKLPDSWPRPLAVDAATVYIRRPGNDATGHSLQAWQLTADGEFALQAEATLETPARSIHFIQDMIAVTTQDSVHAYDRYGDPLLQTAGHAGRSSCTWYNLDHADGSLEEGLWIPLGLHGLHHLQFTQ